MYDAGQLWQSVRSIKALFDILEIKNALADGEIPYPPPLSMDSSDNLDIKKSRGMKIEFRYALFVTSCYPSAQQGL